MSRLVAAAIMAWRPREAFMEGLSGKVNVKARSSPARIEAAGRERRSLGKIHRPGGANVNRLL